MPRKRKLRPFEAKWNASHVALIEQDRAGFFDKDFLMGQRDMASELVQELVRDGEIVSVNEQLQRYRLSEGREKIVRASIAESQAMDTVRPFLEELEELSKRYGLYIKAPGGPSTNPVVFKATGEAISYAEDWNEKDGTVTFTACTSQGRIG